MSGTADAGPESLLSSFLHPVSEKTSEQTITTDNDLLNI